MRHLDPIFYRTAVALWRLYYSALPAEQQKLPPDICQIQAFDLQRADYMNWHTDSKPDARRGGVRACVAA